MQNSAFNPMQPENFRFRDDTSPFAGGFARFGASAPLAGDNGAVDEIAAAQDGLLGDVKRFDGLIEFRIDHGPGYRLYAVQRGNVLIILLCGGDKESQPRDIATARAMADELE